MTNKSVPLQILSKKNKKKTKWPIILIKAGLKLGKKYIILIEKLSKFYLNV